MKGRQKVPKDLKLGILNLVEAAPFKRVAILKKLDMPYVKYFRWTQKYYLDNCLEDKRGGRSKTTPRLEDLYRRQISEIRANKFLGHAVVGPERIADELELQGIFLSHETVRKILHQQGLIEPRPKVAVHEFKRFEAEAKNDLWQMDFLYLFVQGVGYIFLCSVLDDFSRKIIHWQLSPNATAELAVSTLKGAVSAAKSNPKRVLTDRGIQFFTGQGKAKGKFERFLEDANVEHTLARVRHPQTLGKIERYHRSLRQECLNHYVFDDPIETRRIVREYVHNYNNFRKHKGIGRVTPHQRYSGTDAQVRKLREQLRSEFLATTKSRLSHSQIQTEIAVKETIIFVRSALEKEVIIA